MQSREILSFPRLVAVGLFGLLLLGNSSAWASDPLDDTDGTEGWDQVIQPKSKKPVQVEAERNTFKREVADWETIRQLWQTERERYLAEKGSHQRLLKRLKASKRPAPEADITENTDWGDESGDAWMEPSTSGSLDRLIDDELDESGAMPSKQPPKSVKTGSADMDGDESGDLDSIPSAFKQQRERDTAEEKRRKQEEDAARDAAKLLEEQRERERLEELAKKHKLAEERRKKEEEARAGEAAAAALLKMQEEEMKREQEALRKKAKLKVDKEGQVVDPDLQTEMNEEEEEEEEE